MIDSMPHRIDRTGPRATGWLVSCLLHGSLAVAAILFVQRMQLAQQPEPFKWNVTMVEPSLTAAPSTPETALLPARAKTAPAPALQRSSPSTSTVYPASETPQPTVATPAIPPPPPVTPVSELPAPTPLPPATPPQPSAEFPTQPPPPAKTELAHETVREATLHPLTASAKSEPVISQPAAPVPPTPSAASLLQPAQPAPTTQSTETPSALPPDDPPSVAAAVPSPKFETPPKPATTAPAEPLSLARSNPAPAHSPKPAIQQLAPAAEPQMAAVAPTAQLKSAKPDYGWLSDLMARWIEDLDKRYPAMLRTEGVQGKVTLTALLLEDGVLSDVRVAKSSGNAMLDQVALEDVRKGPPITLSRPLERPQIPVKFSIIYDLKTAR